MLKKLRFPFLYLIELLLWLPLLAGFVVTASFLAAKQINSLCLKGKTLPSSWEAAVVNHDKFFEGFLISKHSVAFSLGLILIVASASALDPIYKAVTIQRQTAQGSRKALHNVAHLLVGVIIIATFYLVFTYILVGVAPT